MNRSYSRQAGGKEAGKGGERDSSGGSSRSQSRQVKECSQSRQFVEQAQPDRKQLSQDKRKSRDLNSAMSVTDDSENTDMSSSSPIRLQSRAKHRLSTALNTDLQELDTSQDRQNTSSRRKSIASPIEHPSRNRRRQSVVDQPTTSNAATRRMSLADSSSHHRRLSMANRGQTLHERGHALQETFLEEEEDEDWEEYEHLPYTQCIV